MSPACSDRQANIPSRFLAYHSNLLDPLLNLLGPVEGQVQQIYTLRLTADISLRDRYEALLRLVAPKRLTTARAQTK